MSGTLAPFSSADYWEAHYLRGDSNGAGSPNRLARYKAAFINSFVANNAATSVIEFGCGDGSQLALFNFPRYIGVDVSPAALRLCREKNGHRAGYSFLSPTELEQADSCEIALSVDVVCHLVEDAIFERHTHDLFLFATRFVVIYSSNNAMAQTVDHVRHRHFTQFVARRHPEWRLAATVPNIYPFDPTDPDGTSFADYHIFVPADRSRTFSITSFTPEPSGEQ